ncbi:MAG: ABC transporter permease [Armatimonadetes bacterium]|nr:ABC transporter permease [Armatimonadota bacterium]
MSTNPVSRILAKPETRAILAFAIVVLCGLLLNGDGSFLRFGTHRDALRQMSVYGILACGMTVVVLSGGIDLSVGSVLALSAVLLSKMVIHWQISPAISVLVVVAVGGFAGWISGALVAFGRMQAFIATLAMMVTARGMAKLVSGGEKVATNLAMPDGSMKYVEVPGLYRTIDSRILGGNLSVVTLIFFACFAITFALLARHRWGREVVAIGGNEEAARLSGVPVKASKIWAYVLCGAFAAIAGICQAAQEQQGDPEAGTGYELTAIAMVVMGGTSLMGGRGSVGLTLVGILTIGYVEKILSINAVPEALRLIITGAIIVVAVFTQKRR